MLEQSKNILSQHSKPQRLMMAGGLIVLVLAALLIQKITASEQAPEGSAELIEPTYAMPEHILDEMADSPVKRLDLKVSELAEKISALEAQRPDINKAVEPLTQITNELYSRLTELQRQYDAFQTNLDAFSAQQQQLLTHQQQLGQQLATLQQKQAKSPKPKRTRHRAPRPAFTLESIDLWNGQPSAVLQIQGVLTVVRKGEEWTGWRIHSIRYPDAIKIIHLRTGKVREIKKHG